MSVRAFLEADLDDVLDRLFRFSRAIQRSGETRRRTRVAQFVEGGVENEAEHISAAFRQRVVEYLDMRTQRGTWSRLESNPLKERILDTICLRQQYFAYLTWRRQSRRPQHDETHTRQTPVVSRSSMARSGTVSITRSTGSIPKIPASNPQKNRTSQIKFMAPTTVESRAEPMMSEVDLKTCMPEDVAIDLPARPTIPSTKGIKEMECPYCFQICPVPVFEKANWP